MFLLISKPILHTCLINKFQVYDGSYMLRLLHLDSSLSEALILKCLHPQRLNHNLMPPLYPPHNSTATVLTGLKLFSYILVSTATWNYFKAQSTFYSFLYFQFS